MKGRGKEVCISNLGKMEMVGVDRLTVVFQLTYANASALAPFMRNNTDGVLRSALSYMTVTNVRDLKSDKTYTVVMFDMELRKVPKNKMDLLLEVARRIAGELNRRDDNVQLMRENDKGYFPYSLPRIQAFVEPIEK